MNYILSILIVCCSINFSTQSYIDEIMDYRKKLNDQYSGEHSPLMEIDRSTFQGLGFFPISLKYRIDAKFVRTADTQPFEMKTSTDRLPIYQKYGEAHFELDDKQYTLNLYQDVKAKNIEAYKDLVFLPYADDSNGDSSYGGGRFIYIQIPKNDTIVIDFNRSFNPLCAYNKKFSCPIPPPGNYLDTEILAGVLKPHFQH